MHLTHKPLRPFTPTTPEHSHSHNNKALTKILNNVNSILTPLSPDKSTITNINELLTFKTSQDNYLTHTISLLTKPKCERTNIDLHIISGYFVYLNEFYNMIKRNYKDKTKDVLKQIADVMNYVKYESNELIIRNGDEGKLYYLILNGSVDVFVKKSYHEKLTLNDYYRYIAFLIGYNEIELVNEVINKNKDIVPIEISDSNGYGKVISNTKSSSQMIITTTYTQVTLDEIFRTLTIDEWNELNSLGHVLINTSNGKVKPLNEWYDYNNSIRTGSSTSITRFKHNNKIHITSDEYLLRFNKYKMKSLSNNINKEQDLFLYKLKDVSLLQNNTLFPLTLYCYIKKTSLMTGQCFGEFALNDHPYCRRTATVISNTTCHLGTFTRHNYITLIKEAAERSKKLYMLFILSLQVFKGLSLNVLQKKYFTNFIIHKIEKNSFAIKENENMQYIYLFKQGTYEHTINTSLYGVTDIINTLYDKVKSIMNNNSNNTSNSNSSSMYDKIKSNVVMLGEDIKQMKQENDTINSIAKEVPLLKRFYYDKIVFKIYTSDTHELLGFDDLCLKNNESIFSVKCVSTIGEYLMLSKYIYNDMSDNNNDVLKREKEYCYMKNNKTIKRLLDIRKSKIQTFIDQYKINNILHLKGYIDPHKSNEDMQTINVNDSQSNSNRKHTTINKKKFNLLLHNTKTLISSPLLMQNFMSSVKAIKHNKYFNTNNRFYSSSTINNTLNNSTGNLSRNNFKTFTKGRRLTLSANRKHGNSNSKQQCASLSINTKSRLSSPLLNNHNSTKTFRHPLSRQHTNLLLPQQDSAFNLSNKKKFQLTRHNLFTQHQRRTQLNHFQTNHSSVITGSPRTSNRHVNKAASYNIMNKMCSNYVQVPSLSNEVNGGNNLYKTRASSSLDVVVSDSKRKDMNSVGDYEIIKKEKYIEQRKVYLMKHTRDFFLRYKDKLKMKKRKKKL